MSGVLFGPWCWAKAPKFGVLVVVAIPPYWAGPGGRMPIPMPPVWKLMGGLKPLEIWAPLGPIMEPEEGKAVMVEPCTGAGRGALAKERLFRDVMLFRRLFVRSLACNRRSGKIYREETPLSYRLTLGSSPGRCGRPIAWPPAAPVAAGSSAWPPAPAPSPSAVSPPASATSTDAQRSEHQEGAGPRPRGERGHDAVFLPCWAARPPPQTRSPSR